MDPLEKQKLGSIRWIKHYTNKCRKLLAEMAGVSFGGVRSVDEIKFTVSEMWASGRCISAEISSYNLPL